MVSVIHAVAAVSAMLAMGCTSLAGLSGDYTVGDGGTGGTAGAGGTAGTGGAGASSGSGGSGAGSTSSGTGGTSCTPVGHDEDGDTVDDACDNCPSYGNQTQVDGDQDEVGDACEAPGDPALWHTVASFDAFVAAPGSAWDLGAYSHALDELQISTPYDAGRNADWLTPQTGSYSVETTFAYDGNEAAWAGVRFAINGQSWWACLAQRTWVNNEYRYNIGLWEYPGTGTSVLPRAEAQNVGAEPAGRPRRVRAHVRPGGSVLCTYDDTDNRHGEVEYQVGNADGRVGLRAYDTYVHFFNFVTYQ